MLDRAWRVLEACSGTVRNMVQEAGAGKKSAQFKLDKEVSTTWVLNSFFCASIVGDSLTCGYVLGVTGKSARY